MVSSGSTPSRPLLSFLSFALLALCLFLPLCSGKGFTVTVTETRKRCSTSLHSKEITTSHHTRPASPSPGSDNQANSGVAFLLQLQHVSVELVGKRASSEYIWLMTNGTITEDCSRAARYRINNGQLHVHDEMISTSRGVDNMVFSGSSSVEDISRKFFVQGGKLHWMNNAFMNGMARFYTLKNTVRRSTSVLAILTGNTHPQKYWKPVNLLAQPGKCRKAICGKLISTHSRF